MENLISYLCFGAILLWAISGSRKISILKKECDLLERMQTNYLDVLNIRKINELPLAVLRDVAENITSYYAKTIEKWGATTIGEYYLSLETVPKRKKELLKTAFKASLNHLPGEQTATIFIDAIREKLGANNLETLKMIQTTKNLLLESLISSESALRLNTFSEALLQKANALKAERVNEERNQLIQAEIIEISKTIKYTN